MIHPPNSSHAQRAAMKLPTKNRDTDFMEQQTYTEVQTDPTEPQRTRVKSRNLGHHELH